MYYGRENDEDKIVALAKSEDLYTWVLKYMAALPTPGISHGNLGVELRRIM